SILGQQGYYDNVVWAGHPTNANFLIAGGINLWRSTDGGRSFRDISDWTKADRGSIHSDHHVIVADPAFDGGGNLTVYFPNDGGIYRTRDVLNVGSDPDRKSGWESLNATYGTTQFYGGAVNGDGTVVGGAQDNGTLELDSGGAASQWKTVGEGDGGRCVAQA